MKTEVQTGIHLNLKIYHFQNPRFLEIEGFENDKFLSLDEFQSELQFSLMDPETKLYEDQKKEIRLIIFPGKTSIETKIHSEGFIAISSEEFMNSSLLIAMNPSE